MQSEPEEQVHRTSLLSSEAQISRFDRWVEFIAAVVLSLATVATAWAGYQATLWGGDQSAFMAEANAANIRSAQLANQAMQRGSLHASLFVTWAAAMSEENTELADFLYDRFPPELRTAADAWIATKPIVNPDAPKSPFAMAEYVLPEHAASIEAGEQAMAASAKADEANEVSDRYVLLTVIFASVLFFGGISGKFQSKYIDMGMLGLSILVFLVGLGILITYPIQ
jgi:hypothetical protein